MTTQEIEIDGKVLARLIPASSWDEGLSFFSKDSEFVQVGAWRYNKGKQLLAHIHNQAERVISHTQEVLYICKGVIKVVIYNLTGKPVKEWIAKEGDTVILLNGGHGYEILEDNTRVLEVKNGPYLGAETDRTRL